MARKAIAITASSEDIEPLRDDGNIWRRRRDSWEIQSEIPQESLRRIRWNNTRAAQRKSKAQSTRRRASCVSIKGEVGRPDSKGSRKPRQSFSTRDRPD